MNVDGGQQTTMLNDSNSWIVDMARCGESLSGFLLGFHGGTNRTEIWRANSDGSNPTQLTKGVFDYFRRARRMELGFTMMNRKGRTR